MALLCGKITRKKGVVIKDDIVVVFKLRANQTGEEKFLVERADVPFGDVFYIDPAKLVIKVLIRFAGINFLRLPAIVDSCFSDR